jgi:hypothetical protein
LNQALAVQISAIDDKRLTRSRSKAGSNIDKERDGTKNATLVSSDFETLIRNGQDE